MMDTKLRSVLYSGLRSAWEPPNLTPQTLALYRKRVNQRVSGRTTPNTYYVDLENGNDSNDGLSFANRLKTWDYGPWSKGAMGGDTVRIMGSAAATSLGQNGKWIKPLSFWTTTEFANNCSNTSPMVVTMTAGHGLITGDYVFMNGQDVFTMGIFKVTVIDSQNFSLQNLDGTNSSAPGYAANVYIYKIAVVELTTAVTQDITCFGNYGQRVAWTPSSNVTVTNNSAYTAAGSGYPIFTIAPAFTTGKVAYVTTGTLNLSSFQQVCFKYSYYGNNTGYQIADGQFQLKLCSDTAGNTAVHTINLTAAHSQDYTEFRKVVFDNAAALGSSIQSVALYITSALGSASNVQFVLDNVFAAKASSANDSVTLSTMIGKNNGEPWWQPEAIVGKAIILCPSYQGYTPHYSGPNETVTTYKKNMILYGTNRLGPDQSLPTSTSDNINRYDFFMRGGGTPDNLLYYEFGWDRTSMSSQTLDTWICPVDDGHGAIATSSLTSGGYSINKLGLMGYHIAFSLSGTGIKLNNIEVFAGPSFNPDYFNITNGSITNYRATGGNYGYQWTLTNCYASNITFYDSGNVTWYNGMYFYNSYLTNFSFAHNTSDAAFTVHFNNTIADTFSATNSIGSTTGNSISLWDSDVRGWTFDASGMTAPSTQQHLNLTEANNSRVFNYTYTPPSGSMGYPPAVVSASFSDRFYFRNTSFSPNNSYPPYISLSDVGLIYGEKDELTAGAVLRSGKYTITTQTSVTQPGSGYAWKINITDVTTIVSWNPAEVKLPKIPVEANKPLTLSVYVQRDNIGMTMRLVIPFSPGGFNKKITSSPAAAGANTWEQLSITITPPFTGVIEPVVEAWSTSTSYNGYVDTFSWTQTIPSIPNGGQRGSNISWGSHYWGQQASLHPSLASRKYFPR